MKRKTLLFTFLSLIILACSRLEFKSSNEDDEILIKTKAIKETEAHQNRISFKVNAKIPVIKNMNLPFEKMVKKWILESKVKIKKTDKRNEKNKYYLYNSDFEVFYNNKIGIVSILYKEHTIDSLNANEKQEYHVLNLKGLNKIEISEVISKDQFDSLLNTLREQVKRAVDKYLKGISKEKFENKFQKYKYYFKNNYIIIFYDPYVITHKTMKKIEFVFPIYENTENYTY